MCGLTALLFPQWLLSDKIGPAQYKQTGACMLSPLSRLRRSRGLHPTNLLFLIPHSQVGFVKAFERFLWPERTSVADVERFVQAGQLFIGLQFHE